MVVGLCPFCELFVRVTVDAVAYVYRQTASLFTVSETIQFDQCSKTEIERFDACMQATDQRLAADDNATAAFIVSGAQRTNFTLLLLLQPTGCLSVTHAHTHPFFFFLSVSISLFAECRQKYRSTVTSRNILRYDIIFSSRRKTSLSSRACWG